MSGSSGPNSRPQSDASNHSSFLTQDGYMDKPFHLSRMLTVRRDLLTISCWSQERS